MKKVKLPLALLVALALSLTLASSSWARPWGHGRGAMNLTPEQAGQMFDLKEKFMHDTASLRREMMVKRAELAALWRAEDPDQTQVLAKQKEINALREKMQEKGVAFRTQARKICPQGPMSRGPGGGMGMGPDGGMGPGRAW